MDKNNYKSTVKATLNVEQLDKDLKTLLDKELPAAPADEWFTRKVMNRLPEAEAKPKVGWIDKAIDIVVAMALVGWWIAAMVSTMHYGLTVGTLCMAIMLPCLTVFLIIVYWAPWLRRLWRE
jgi:hypothetical protein